MNALKSLHAICDAKFIQKTENRGLNFLKNIRYLKKFCQIKRYVVIFIL